MVEEAPSRLAECSTRGQAPVLLSRLGISKRDPTSRATAGQGLAEESTLARFPTK